MSSTPYVVFCPNLDDGKGVAWLFEWLDKEGFYSDGNRSAAQTWLENDHLLSCVYPPESHFVSVVQDPYEFRG